MYQAQTGAAVKEFSLRPLDPATGTPTPLRRDGAGRVRRVVRKACLDGRGGRLLVGTPDNSVQVQCPVTPAYSVTHLTLPFYSIITLFTALIACIMSYIYPILHALILHY